MGDNPELAKALAQEMALIQRTLMCEVCKKVPSLDNYRYFEECEHFYCSGCIGLKPANYCKICPHLGQPHLLKELPVLFMAFQKLRTVLSDYRPAIPNSEDWFQVDTTVLTQNAENCAENDTPQENGWVPFVTVSSQNVTSNEAENETPEENCDLTAKSGQRSVRKHIATPKRVPPTLASATPVPSRFERHIDPTLILPESARRKSAVKAQTTLINTLTPLKAPLRSPQKKTENPSPNLKKTAIKSKSRVQPHKEPEFRSSASKAGKAQAVVTPKTARRGNPPRNSSTLVRKTPCTSSIGSSPSTRQDLIRILSALPEKEFDPTASGKTPAEDSVGAPKTTKRRNPPRNSSTPVQKIPRTFATSSGRSSPSTRQEFITKLSALPEKEFDPSFHTASGRTPAKDSVATKKRNARSNSYTPVRKMPRTSISSPSRSNKKDALTTPLKKNGKGESQLHVAAQRNNLPQAQGLLAAGADPNFQDFAGWTPLHDAVDAGSYAMVSYLLDSGAWVDVPGADNTTALHMAVDRKLHQIAELLLQHGADPVAKDIMGNTPLSAAKDDRVLAILLATKAVSMPPPCLPDFKEVIVFCLKLPNDESRFTDDFIKKFNLKAKSNIFDANHVIVSRIAAHDKFDWSLARVMANGAHIISSSWCDDSLACGELKTVSEYEIHPPWLVGLQQARANTLMLRPGLFSGCQIMVVGEKYRSYRYGDGSIDVKELRAFIGRCGGKPIKRLPDPESPLLQRTVPYHATPGPLESCSQIVVYFPQSSEVPVKYNMTHLKCLPIKWLIDCIVCFKLIDDTTSYLP